MVKPLTGSRNQLGPPTLASLERVCLNSPRLNIIRENQSAHPDPDAIFHDHVKCALHRPLPYARFACAPRAVSAATSRSLQEVLGLPEHNHAPRGQGDVRQDVPQRSCCMPSRCDDDQIMASGGGDRAFCAACCGGGWHCVESVLACCLRVLRWTPKEVGGSGLGIPFDLCPL